MAAVRTLLALLLLVLAPMALGADDPLKISAITLSTNADGQQVPVPEVVGIVTSGGTRRVTRTKR